MSDESLKLNRLSPAAGSRSARKRVGRGIGSGLGKTCGRGHKGQHARSGGYHKVGFEGGQMPLQRRLPKVGFAAPTNAHTQEVRLYHLGAVKGDVIDPATLVEAGVVGHRARKIKLINTGAIDRAVTVRGIQVTAGAVKAIEAAGGKVE